MATQLAVHHGRKDLQILLAHRHPFFRDSVRPLLAKLSPNSVLLEATDFENAMAIAAASDGIDLLLIGEDLPGLNGTAGIERLHHAFPVLRLVLLTEGKDPAFLLAAMAAGAAGVMLKNLSANALQSALRLVLSGELYLPAEMVAAMIRGATRRGGERINVKFSPAETQVVPLLLDGLCNKIIARRLDIEEAAVKARLRGIYKKMGVVNRAQAVMRLLPDNRIPMWEPSDRSAALSAAE
jgi:DNA-binding NarL/FixJ family response regulator